MSSTPSKELLKECCTARPFDTCPECFLPCCRNCGVACYECVKAWRHWHCGKDHMNKTYHQGWLNDLNYLVNGSL
jgi:hypothetical protein